jgi:hypothetical protein
MRWKVAREQVTKLTDFPEWRAADGKLGELGVEQNRLDERRRKIEMQITARRGGLQAGTAASNRIKEQALAMLQDSAMPADDVSLSELERELETIRGKQPIVAEAVNLAKKARHELQLTLSRKIAEGYSAEHDRLVLAVRKAALELAAANLAEQEGREALADAGVLDTGILCPMSFIPGQIGRLRDENSAIARFVRECEEYGY